MTDVAALVALLGTRLLDRWAFFSDGNRFSTELAAEAEAAAAVASTTDIVDVEHATAVDSLGVGKVWPKSVTLVLPLLLLNIDGGASFAAAKLEGAEAVSIAAAAASKAASEGRQLP